MRAGEHFGFADPGNFRPASRRPAALPGLAAPPGPVAIKSPKWGPDLRTALVMGTVADLEDLLEVHVETPAEPSTAGWASRPSSVRSGGIPAGFVTQTDPSAPIGTVPPREPASFLLRPMGRVKVSQA